MQVSSTPVKWTVPFAQGDGARVEIPATTADPTRFSLTLGSPPLTGQPPETGGVPPQLEDFNGAMNQIARIAWWAQGGGAFPYDATWAGDSAVNGYAQGAQISFSDYSGTWLSLADNNTANPDTVGTNWAPVAAYGVTALTGQTGGTVTLTPLQAAKRMLTIAGTLTSNLIIVVPAWTYDWSVTNLTTGAFTVTVKTAAGAGVLIPQNSKPAPVRGDGTNIVTLNPAGRLINVQTFGTAGTFTYTPTAGTLAIKVTVVGGGGAGGGTAATAAGQVSVASGGGSGACACSYLTSGFSGASIVVGSGGTGVSGGTGGAGTASSFGSISVNGGGGGNGGAAGSVFPAIAGYGAGGLAGTGGNITNGAGGFSFFGYAPGASNGISGTGGASLLGGGAAAVINSSTNGNNGVTPGAGGSGALSLTSSAAHAGGNGAPGIVIIEEYA